MDEIPTKNSFPNDVLKKYARTKDINDEYSLDAGAIAQTQRNELSVNLKVNASKQSFGKTEVEYLGYVVICNRTKPQQNKIKVILKMSRISTVKEARSFLGMV